MVVPWNSAAGAPDLSDYLPGFCERVERALTAAITDNLSIDNFWSTLLGAIVISLVSSVLGIFVKDD